MSYQYTPSKDIQSLLSKRDLMEINGMDTKDIDTKILSKGIREVFNCKDPEFLAECEKADQRSVECAMRYDNTVGTNLHPLEEARKACKYILDCLDVIDKSKNLDEADLYVDYLGYAVISIGTCTERLTNRYEDGYVSPYEKHGFKEIRQVKSAPPVDKLRTFKNLCKTLRKIVYSADSLLSVPVNPASYARIYHVVCDLYAQNGELEYTQCLKNKKSFPF